MCQSKGGQPGEREDDEEFVPTRPHIHAQGWNKPFGRFPPHSDLVLSSPRSLTEEKNDLHSSRSLYGGKTKITLLRVIPTNIKRLGRKLAEII